MVSGRKSKENRRRLRGRVIQEGLLNPTTRVPRRFDTPDGAVNLDIPPEEKEVLKTVPAKVGDEVVGDAVIYNDGTTDIILNDDISEKAKAKMGDVVMAFNKETGAAMKISDFDFKEKK